MKTQAIVFITALLLTLHAAPVLADYAAEAKAVGGAWVHETIANADTLELFEISNVEFSPQLRFEKIDGPRLIGPEQKHILTQHIGRAALRAYRPVDPREPTHLLRFKRGSRVVNVFVSTHDGSLRIVRDGNVVSTLGEPDDVPFLKSWLNLKPAHP